MDKKEIRKLLEEIGLSPAEVSVYMVLLDGVKSIKEILKVTNEKRPTVYYSLNSLEKRGLVSKSGKDYGNKFQVEPIEKLIEFVDKSLRKQNILLEKVKKLKSLYPKSSNSGAIVSYFDNIDSIKSAIFYSLYSKEKLIRSIVPADNFFQELGLDFIEEYVGEKVKRMVRTKAIWEDIPSKDVIEVFYKTSDIKQLPVDMHNSFETTVFIYDDKTLYISPKKENFATLVQSKEHSKMMRSIFDNLWKNSLEIKRK